MSSIVLDHWQYSAAERSASLVYPDGCRDLIMRQKPEGPPVWYITQLDETARPVICSPHEKIMGFRFRPGATIQALALLQEAQSYTDATTDLYALIESVVALDADIHEALSQLSRDDITVERAAKLLKVSTRSLQRKVLASTGKPPGFWVALARVRRAAQQLSEHKSLSILASDCGFADQAHLSREIKRWFSHTPSQLRQDSQKLLTLTTPGYG